MVALFSALPTHAYSQYYNPWRHFPAPNPAPAQPEEPRDQSDVLARVSRDQADTAAFFQYLNVPAPKVRQEHHQQHLPVTMISSTVRSTSLGGTAAAPPTTSPATSRGGATGRPASHV